MCLIITVHNPQTLFKSPDIKITANLLSHFFTVKAGNISIRSPEKSLIRSVQEDVFLSVDVKCLGVPTIQWTFMSGLVSRTIGTWQPGVFTNITADYSSRVRPYDNGSMELMDLRLQDAGYYVVTVTDMAGSSRDTSLVLKVNGKSDLVGSNILPPSPPTSLSATSVHQSHLFFSFSQ